eukprot:6925776-Alexandrium_andersonii.AAC.1
MASGAPPATEGPNAGPTFPQRRSPSPSSPGQGYSHKQPERDSCSFPPGYIRDRTPARRPMLQQASRRPHRVP